MTKIESLLRKFMEGTPNRSEWVEARYWRLYVRKREVDGVIFLIFANINCSQLGRGWFTGLLSRLEPDFNIMVEQILNDRLPDFLRRRGYKIYHIGSVPQAKRMKG